MTIAKNQHFLPQFYIRQFIDPDTPSGWDPFVWVFELSENRWRRRAPKKVASLRHYYAYRDENNQLINLIDPTFTAIESLGANLIRKLEVRETLTEKEQRQFSFFVALMTIRTPQHRGATEHFIKHAGQNVVASMIQRWREFPEEFDMLKRNYAQKIGQKYSMNIDDFELHAPEIALNDAGIIGYSLSPVIWLAARLMEMTWTFYSTQVEDRLIICDHPGDFTLPDVIIEDLFLGFFTQDVEFHIPLSPNMIFAAHDDGASRRFGGPLDHEQVVKLNQRMAMRAEKFIVSTQPTFLGDDILHQSNG